MLSLKFILCCFSSCYLLHGFTTWSLSFSLSDWPHSAILCSPCDPIETPSATFNSCLTGDLRILPAAEGLPELLSYLNILVGIFLFSSKATLNLQLAGNGAFSYYWNQWVKAYVFNGGFGKHGISVIIRFGRSKPNVLFSVLQIQINGLNQALQFVTW